MKSVHALLLFAVLLTACAPAAVAPTVTPVDVAAIQTSAVQTVLAEMATDTPNPPTATSTEAPTATSSPTLEPTATFTATITETPTIEPSPTTTETVAEMLKNRIVFYLIWPEKGRLDACGEITAEPIISKRYRTGDKIQDVQIALNMLFSVGSQFYGAYYNALWNTQLDIQDYTYEPVKDYMTIRFGGYLPIGQISDCDKHGIREQIWKTFYHYGFKEKTFMYYDKFFIDQLSR